MTKIYPKVRFGDKLVDKSRTSLNIASSAVLYGLSVYTVFPIMLQKDKKMAAFRLEEHFNRLCQSAKIIGLDKPRNKWGYHVFVASTRRLIRQNKLTKNAFVRASLHVDDELAGTRSRGLNTILSMFAYDAQPILPQRGARLKTSVWRRVPDFSIPSRAKVNGAYVNSVLAKQEAIDSGYDDCVFLDNHGHVCELSAANIFIIRHGKLITPSATSDLLEGITRRTIIELAIDLGIEVQEKPIDLTELYIADEVFASGTSAYVAPIVEIDSRPIANGQPGELTLKLQKIHRDVLHGQTYLHKNWLTVL